MKNLFKILPILFISFSFTQEQIVNYNYVSILTQEQIVNYNDLVLRDGILYTLQPYEPYTGKVVQFYNGFYNNLVTNLPKIENGFAFPMAGVGLGTELHKSLLNSPDTSIKKTPAIDL